MNIALLKEKLEELDQLFCEKDSLDEKKSFKALILDLSDESSYSWPIPQEYLDSYVSGPALGARLWAHFVGSDVDKNSTYEAHNPIVITASILSNSGMPGCESLSIAFRSPVTGKLSFNVLSNTFGMRLMSLGYIALVVVGRLRRPTIIDIRKSGVTYNVSETFVGYTISQIENLVGTSAMTTALSIGPAGEQKVPFAAVVSEGKTTGRGGLGCIFGFKNIKSLIITGFNTDFVRTGDSQAIEEALKNLRNVLSKSNYNNLVQRCGTACIMRSASKNGWASVLNFTRRTDPRLFHLAGDEVSRRYGTEHFGCISCPIMCRHKTKDDLELPPLEDLIMLGSNIGCFDIDKVIARSIMCTELGLDSVSVGNVLGWAYSAHNEKKTTLLGEDFSFTNNEDVLPLIEMIARRQGPGETLSYGTYALGQALEDDSFSYTICGLECGPYDYRGLYCQSISDCMGFWFMNQFEVIGNLCSKDPALWASFNEALVMGLESFGISSALIYSTMIENNKSLKRLANIIPKLAIKMVKLDEVAICASAIHNQKIDKESVIELGNRCWRLIYEINCALGFDMLSDVDNLIPNHFRIDSFSNHKNASIVPYSSLISRYVFLRKQTIACQNSKI